jgi:hypothetical protein
VYNSRVTDAETLLRRARRPLVIGMGGGGDVVGALATAESTRFYDGAHPVLGGITWERRPIDPVPGPRSEQEIEGARVIAPGVMLATRATRTRDRAVVFAESLVAGLLGEPVVLIDPGVGAAAVAGGLGRVAAELACDLIVVVDVGGDVIANGDEPGLRSPLCDAIMLAAGARLAADGHPTLLGIFGIGCDAELTPEEVLARIALVAAGGGLGGVRGLTEPVALRLERAIETVPTEASAQAVRAFRGANGPSVIRGGTRTVQLSSAAALTFYLDATIAYRVAAPLARAVAEARTLEQANDALTALGVRTELDLEREAAADSAG